MDFIHFYSAHPIHPPKMTGDPWQCEFQPDCGYKLKLEKGVYSVYKNEEDLAANKPINYDVRCDVKIILVTCFDLGD